MIPLLLSVTVFAEAPLALNLIILVPTAILLLVPASEPGPPLPSSHSPSRAHSPSGDAPVVSDSNAQNAIPSLPPLAALTTYRSHMLLLTFICILAVDFPVFPRSMAKCESFGVSMVVSLCSLKYIQSQSCLDGPRGRLLRIFSRHCLRYTSYQKAVLFEKPYTAKVSQGSTEMFAIIDTGFDTYTISQGY